MPKRRGLVLLQHEMSCPRETVSNRKEQQRVPRMSGHERAHDDSNPQCGPNRMQNAIPRIAVLPQIELEELIVGSEFWFVSHSASFDRGIASVFIRGCF